MKPQVRKHLLTCALLAGLGAGFVVQAQTPPAAPAERQHGHGHEGKHDPAKRAERMQQRLADLKQKLRLAPNQEAAWSIFTTAMQPAQRARLDRDAVARMSTPERIDHLRTLRDERNAEMDRRGQATKAFYGQLSAEQKKTFDDETLRMFSHRHGRGGMGGKHHG